MASINYYLDKPDKKGYSPIHLRINCKGDQIKLSTGEKVNPNDFDKKNQFLKDKAENSEAINHYLNYLKERADDLLNKSSKKTFTFSEVKEQLQEYIKAYKEGNEIILTKEQMNLYGRTYSFVDLFAGAGGFSEGFLQAEYNDKYFNFLLGSDINKNCELTHIVRYNHQLGLNAKFLKQDITEPDFLENLKEQVGDQSVDVVCGGPPCQSFSLAGKRKKFDKKDDLFSHYLEVIKSLRPKYFVMENVKGILTKENGKIKDLILKEINSILDFSELHKLTSFIKKFKKESGENEYILDCIGKRVELESVSFDDIDHLKEEYIKTVESKFQKLTPKIVDYKTSKTDERINTIRHGLNLLRRNKEIEKLRIDVIKEKDLNYIDGDYFVEIFDGFLKGIEIESIINNIKQAFDKLDISKKYQSEYINIILALEIYTETFDDCINRLEKLCSKKQKEKLNKILNSIRLYKINSPLVVNASDYGVPQNRERVLFIGCRKDQKLISEIPATVKEDEKVTVAEALYDLDFLENNDVAHDYNGIDHLQNDHDLPKRTIDGEVNNNGLTYAEWSKTGRLNGRFNPSPPFYVRNFEDLEQGKKTINLLHNHKTSNQSEKVLKRLELILNAGDYDSAQEELLEYGLSSKKRNYNVLQPDGQSPTIMTIPDDYIHFNTPRALTVREMARLQSFDDSFVFQGKRSTGGSNRKHEIPQYTLVGNAVPPLLARAIGMEILKAIK